MIRCAAQRDYCHLAASYPKLTSPFSQSSVRLEHAVLAKDTIATCLRASSHCQKTPWLRGVQSRNPQASQVGYLHPGLPGVASHSRSPVGHVPEMNQIHASAPCLDYPVSLDQDQTTEQGSAPSGV